MDETFKSLTPTDKVTESDKFALCVIKDDDYDFGVTFSTGGNLEMQEFSQEDYELKERIYKYDTAGMIICIGEAMISSIFGGDNKDDDSENKKYWAERENSVLDEISAEELAKYMYESKPVNVEKYEPFYWQANAKTKGMSGSVYTMPPLRFIQKNNGNHYIYGMGYLRYKTPDGQIETIYTDALPTTLENIPDYTVSKRAGLQVGARQMDSERLTAQGIDFTSVRRAPSDSEENLDMRFVFAPETQLAIYVDGKYSADLSDSYGYGDKVTITAPEVSGKTFSYWMADGSVISSAQTLSMTMNAHTTLRAVYGATVPAASTAGITSVTSTNGNISIQAIADAQATAAGIVYSTTTSEPTIDGDGVTQVEAVKYSDITTELPASVLDQNNCWMLQITPDNEDTVYHVRAYATVGGNTTYGDVKDVKLADLESGIMRIANLEAFETGVTPTLSDRLRELRGSGAISFGYSLTVTDGSENHGTVEFTVDGKTKASANKNDVVTVTINPEEGYIVTSVTTEAYTSWNYTLTVAAGRFATFFAGENIQLDAQTPEDVTLHTITSVSGTEATVGAKLEGIITAETPLLAAVRQAAAARRATDRPRVWRGKRYQQPHPQPLSRGRGEYIHPRRPPRRTFNVQWSMVNVQRCISRTVRRL